MNKDMSELLRWADYPLAKSGLAWLQPGPCTDAGWLWKLGHVRKSYKKRWFKVSQKTLYYYKDPSSSTPLGSLSLLSGKVSERPSPESNMKGFFFEFLPGAKVQKSHSRFARSIILKALTARSRSEWIETLERCSLSASKTVLLAAKSMGQKSFARVQNDAGDPMLDSELNDITPWGDDSDEERNRNSPYSQRSKSKKQDNVEDKISRLRTKLRAAAYAQGGINWKKLFRHYDRDNKGTLDYSEFRSAVRRDGKMNANTLHDKDLQLIFHKVDFDDSGEIDLHEFTAWLTNPRDASTKKIPYIKGTNQKQSNSSRTSNRINYNNNSTSNRYSRKTSPVRSSGYGNLNGYNTVSSTGSAKYKTEPNDSNFDDANVYDSSTETKKAWSPHSKSPDSQMNSSPINMFESVSMDSFDRDRRRNHRNNLAKKAHSRKSSGVISVRSATQQRNQMMPTKSITDVNDKAYIQPQRSRRGSVLQMGAKGKAATFSGLATNRDTRYSTGVKTDM